MKKLLILPLLAATLSLYVSAQTKPDSTYRLSETQIIQISQLLDYGLKAAGNSDKVSTAAYNQYAIQVAKIDSTFRAQYVKFHPVKEQSKKDQK